MARVKELISAPVKTWLRLLRDSFRRSPLARVVFDAPLTLLRIHKKRSRTDRNLEIGPGDFRIPGFETLSAHGGPYVDYVWDCARRLPFPRGCFTLIYASHVLEHLPWYQAERVLGDWVRALKEGGRLEVWVPDGLKICKTLLDAELNGEDNTRLDGWYKFNPDKDPCVWASGRIYSYGDSMGNPADPNWHRALFTPRYLELLFRRIGLTQIRQLRHNEVRGYDHGWINLGMTGIKS